VTAPTIATSVADASRPSRSAWLLVIAAAGFILPNGLFVYWMLFEWPGVAAVLANHLAVAFMLDAFVTMGLLAWWFAKRPIGHVRWPWFVALSLLGGLWFSIPMYWWLNGAPPSASR